MPLVKKLEITTIEEVKEYLKFLASEGLAYHIDDCPDDIRWDVKLSDDDKCNLGSNHIAMLEVCNPWELFDEDTKLWEIYSNS